MTMDIKTKLLIGIEKFQEISQCAERFLSTAVKLKLQQFNEDKIYEVGLFI